MLALTLCVCDAMACPVDGKAAFCLTEKGKADADALLLQLARDGSVYEDAAGLVVARCPVDLEVSVAEVHAAMVDAGVANGDGMDLELFPGLVGRLANAQC